MFGIGQFAQFAKVSVRTLRHYDERDDGQIDVIARVVISPTANIDSNDVTSLGS